MSEIIDTFDSVALPYHDIPRLYTPVISVPGVYSSFCHVDKLHVVCYSLSISRFSISNLIYFEYLGESP